MRSTCKLYCDGKVYFRSRYDHGDDGSIDIEDDVSSNETDDDSRSGATNQPAELLSAQAQLSETATILNDVVKDMHLLNQTSRDSGCIGFPIAKLMKLPMQLNFRGYCITVIGFRLHFESLIKKATFHPS
ncbi:hypothetical protein DPMN_041609 [Dreissena polymorpha]|uniref:Uncharacterized protein n=1 Tax=Dreissena polymorpha TaxID=45954 RepID=A0A9D4CX89_DREPO|nr:hypothetical protein DPMN_041609 [Dreissena polymorpha]